MTAILIALAVAIAILLVILWRLGAVTKSLGKKDEQLDILGLAVGLAQCIKSPQKLAKIAEWYYPKESIYDVILVQIPLMES